MYRKRIGLLCLCIICLCAGVLTGCKEDSQSIKESAKAAKGIDGQVYLAQIESLLTEDEVPFENLQFLGTSVVKETRDGVGSYVSYAYDNVRDHKRYICLAPVGWEGEEMTVLHRFDSICRIDPDKAGGFTLRKVLDCYGNTSLAEQTNLLYGEIRDEKIAALQLIDENAKQIAEYKTDENAKGFVVIAPTRWIEKVQAVNDKGEPIEILQGEALEKVLWE